MSAARLVARLVARRAIRPLVRARVHVLPLLVPPHVTFGIILGFLMQLCAWLTAHGSSCLELVAVLFGIVSVFLSVREHIWSWPTALVNVALYFVLFYRSGLYSDMGLQVVYFALSLYGWYEWLYGGRGHTELTVSRTPPRVWAALATIGIVFWALDGYATSKLPGVALPYVDAATTTVSLVAQYMMTRKYLENWILWILVDVVYVGMLIFKGLNLTAFNYAVYFVLAVMGYVSWKRSMAAHPQPAEAPG